MLAHGNLASHHPSEILGKKTIKTWLFNLEARPKSNLVLVSACADWQTTSMPLLPCTWLNRKYLNGLITGIRIRVSTCATGTQCLETHQRLTSF